MRRQKTSLLLFIPLNSTPFFYSFFFSLISLVIYTISFFRPIVFWFACWEIQDGEELYGAPWSRRRRRCDSLFLSLSPFCESLIWCRFMLYATLPTIICILWFYCRQPRASIKPHGLHDSEYIYIHIYVWNDFVLLSSFHSVWCFLFSSNYTRVFFKVWWNTRFLLAREAPFRCTDIILFCLQNGETWNVELGVFNSSLIFDALKNPPTVKN